MRKPCAGASYENLSFPVLDQKHRVGAFKANVVLIQSDLVSLSLTIALPKALRILNAHVALLLETYLAM